MTGSEMDKILMLNSPKVVAMYEAVNQLITEGTDINGLKVSDITRRAGIGKGTAYEYFGTKEELVSKAIFFQIRGSLLRMTRLVEREETFRKKIYILMEHMEQNHDWYQVLVKYFCYYIQGLLEKENFTAEPERCTNDSEELQCFLRHLMEAAMRERILTAEIPCHFIGNAVITQTIGYNMHIGGGFGANEVPPEMMKEYIYRNIIRSIQEAESLTAG